MPLIFMRMHVKSNWNIICSWITMVTKPPLPDITSSGQGHEGKSLDTMGTNGNGHTCCGKHTMEEHEKLKIENSPRVCYTSKRTEKKIFRYLHFHLTATWCTITKPQKQCLLTDKGFWQIWSMQTQGSPILTLCDLHIRDEHHGKKANRLW